MKRVNYLLIFILLFAFNLRAENRDIKKTKEKSFQQKADGYFLDGKFSLAEIYYLKALKEKPDNYDINYNLGRIYYKQEEYKKAIQQLQTAYEIKPKNEIMFRIALCHDALEKPEKALSIYNDIIMKDPNYAKANLEAGIIGVKKLYNKQIAITNWERFLVLRPNDIQASNIRIALGYLRDPNFILKPPGKKGASTVTTGTGPEKTQFYLIPDIKGKDLKSKSEEKYNLKSKKTITTD